MQWHNKFHLEMPKGLVNDPNGLCYHQGKYQIFFQWNPFGCEHKHKHWTYTQTTDFINYTKPQIALAPVDKFDKDGCYSGSARSKNNKLEIIYTANLKDEQNIRYPRQVSVKQNDDGEFIKEKIIIDTVPEGYTTHFRDPYIFTKNNRSFIILGAQRENLTGCALIYEKIDENWIFRGELKTQLTDFGYMWECPNLFTIDDKDILVFCPQGLKAQKYQYQNLYQAGYLIGQFNPDTLEFTHGGQLRLRLRWRPVSPAAADHHRRRQRGDHQPERVRGQPGVRRGGAGRHRGRVRGELPGRRRPGRPERPALPPECPGGPGQLHHYLPHLGHRH